MMKNKRERGLLLDKKFLHLPPERFIRRAIRVADYEDAVKLNGIPEEFRTTEEFCREWTQKWRD